MSKIEKQTNSFNFILCLLEKIIKLVRLDVRVINKIY